MKGFAYVGSKLSDADEDLLDPLQFLRSSYEILVGATLSLKVKHLSNNQSKQKRLIIGR